MKLPTKTHTHLFGEVASIYKGKKPYKCENCDKVFCKSISMIIYMYNTLKFVGNDRLEKHILTVHEKKSHSNLNYAILSFLHLAFCTKTSKLFMRKINHVHDQFAIMLLHTNKVWKNIFSVFIWSIKAIWMWTLWI